LLESHFSILDAFEHLLAERWRGDQSDGENENRFRGSHEQSFIDGAVDYRLGKMSAK